MVFQPVDSNGGTSGVVSRGAWLARAVGSCASAGADAAAATACRKSRREMVVTGAPSCGASYSKRALPSVPDGRVVADTSCDNGGGFIRGLIGRIARIS